MEASAALRQLGVDATADDTVIYLRQFVDGDAPRLVSIVATGGTA